jgi:uncharacterized protein (DUF58 family)
MTSRDGSASRNGSSKRAALLAPEFLAKLERLALLARRPVRGWAAGQRRSRRSGHSVEFNDYRPYGAGDDPRYIDWNIYGRSDRLYVKLFVDDEDLSLHLLVDASASMQWGAPSKLEWAAKLAAALGFVGLAGQERVGLGLLRERASEGWAPGRGRARIPRLIDTLGSAQAQGQTTLNAALSGYAGRLRNGGVAVLISDLLDPQGYESGLQALLERQVDLHLIHVLAPDELDPAKRPELRGDLRLTDAETGEVRTLTVDAEALAGYQTRLAEFLARAEQFCRTHSIVYQRAASDSPVEELVLGPLRGKLLA